MDVESMKWYVKTIQTYVQSTNLRRPTQTNLEKLLKNVEDVSSQGCWPP